MTDPDLGEWMPLTAAQRAVYLGHHVDPDTAAYNTAEYVVFAGAIDAGLLESAIGIALSETQSLRLRFGDNGLRQRSGPVPAWVLPEVDFTAADDPRGSARQWMHAAVQRRLAIDGGELFDQALLRVSETERWWFQIAHHIALDGFGYVLFARRVAEVYSALAVGAALPASRLGELADVVAADEAYQTGPQRHADRDYWASLLGAAVAGSAGTTSAGGPAGTAPHRWVAPVPEAVGRALTAAAGRYAADEGLPDARWTDLVIAATGAYLMRMTDSDQCRLALPLMNRIGGAAGSVVCTTMNLAPVQLLAGSTATVADLVGQVTQQGPGLRQHGRYRAEELARDAERRGFAPLFGAQINLVPFGLELTFGGIRGEVHNVTAGPVDDLTVCLRGTPGRGPLRLELAANPACYGAEDVALHGARLLRFLDVVATAEPDTSIADLPLLSADERAMVTTGFNDTGIQVAARTLPAAFAEQVSRTPAATALIDESGTLTYAEMDYAVSALATRLRAAGIGPGSVAGVALPRSAALVIAVHAVHRAGGAYLPLDLELPIARITAMIDDARPAALIADPVGGVVLSAALAARAGSGPAPTVLPVDDDLSTPGLTVQGPTGAGPAMLDDPAYLIFTSGSTGRPKAAVITHRAIDNRLAWMQDHFGLRAGERVLQKTPAGFDVSVWELFWPLQVGATLVVARPGGHRDPQYLAELIHQHRISTLHFVPSMLAAFLADHRATELVAATGSLTRVVCSGEALPGDLARRAAGTWSTRVTNLYGPTEAAVDVTVHDVDPSSRSAAVPIGRPIWNTRCYVLDGNREPVPIGVPGELYLAGVQLASGYHGKPELTAERFVPDPLWPGERMYATGDLARWSPNGELEYLGRNDFQVKIRGQRAELGEIEAVLSAVRGVGSCCVTVDPSGRVIGYLVGQTAEVAPDLEAARTAAAAALPSWMVPTDFVVLDEWPLSPNGKLDRARLPAPAQRSASASAAPADLIVEQLCALFDQALFDRVDQALFDQARGGGALFDRALGDRGDQDRAVGISRRFGPDDDFFAAGGNSLLALHLLGRIESVLGERPGIGALFAHPTPGGLARQFGSHRAADDLGTLLPLRRNGTARPLFCVHPAGGLSWCYAGLLPHLPPDLPLYGLQASGLSDRDATLPVDLHQMAREYVLKLRRIQPAGPYRLLGWSVGGLVAHEMACQLQDLGQPIELLMMLDAYPSTQWRHLAEPSEPDALRALLRIAGAESAIPDPGDPGAHHPPGSAGEPTRELVRSVLTGRGSALAALPPNVVDAVIDIVRNNSRLVRRSDHRVFDGDLVFVTATQPREETWLDREGWRPFLTGSVVNHDLAVSHKDLVSPAALALIGELIGGHLATGERAAIVGETGLAGAVFPVAQLHRDNPQTRLDAGLGAGVDGADHLQTATVQLRDSFQGDPGLGDGVAPLMTAAR